MKGIPFLLLALVAPAIRSAETDSPFLGTWKYNVARSKVSGDASRLNPSITSTVRVERLAHGFRWTNEAQIDGKPSPFSYEFTLDGKDNPVSGSELYDTMAMSQVDARTWTSVSKKNGRVFSTTT